MLDLISEDLFTEWMAYYNMEPFGSLQGFLRAGIIASTIVNANPFRGKNSKSVSPMDFVPRFIPDEVKDKERKQKVIDSLSAWVANSTTLEEYQVQRRARKQKAKRRKRKLLEKGGEK